jgi:hypothetical protein
LLFTRLSSTWMTSTWFRPTQLFHIFQQLHLPTGGSIAVAACNRTLVKNPVPERRGKPSPLLARGLCLPCRWAKDLWMHPCRWYGRRLRLRPRRWYGGRLWLCLPVGQRAWLFASALMVLHLRLVQYSNAEAHHQGRWISKPRSGNHLGIYSK